MPISKHRKNRKGNGGRNVHAFAMAMRDHAEAVAKRQAEDKERRAKEPQPQTGADRVPESMRGNIREFPDDEFGVHEYADFRESKNASRRGGTKIDSTTGTFVRTNGKVVYGNYAERRAQGVRGHKPTTRRRDMPGAVARRLERNRASWLASKD